MLTRVIIDMNPIINDKEMIDPYDYYYNDELINHECIIKGDGKYLNIDDFPNLNKKIKHEISIVVDRIVLNSNLGNRLADSVETAVNLSNGLLVAEYENETLPKKLRKC